MQCQPIKAGTVCVVGFLVSVSVIGNRSSCLSHASLIVPWPALSCQLQLASNAQNHKKRKGRASSCWRRGDGSEPLYRERDDSFCSEQKYHFCHHVLEYGSKRLLMDLTQIGHPEEDKCLRSIVRVQSCSTKLLTYDTC